MYLKKCSIRCLLVFALIDVYHHFMTLGSPYETEHNRNNNMVFNFFYEQELLQTEALL